MAAKCDHRRSTKRELSLVGEKVSTGYTGYNLRKKVRINKTDYCSLGSESTLNEVSRRV